MAAAPPAARLHAFEIAALLALLMGLGGPTLAGLPPTADVLLRSGAVATGILPLALLVGVGVQLAMRLHDRTRAADYLGDLATRRWWLLWLRLWLACLATSTAYFWAKLCIPLIHARQFDAELWRLDQGLHLGWSPNLGSLALVPPSPILSFLDALYGLWLVSIVAAIAIVTASRGTTFKRSFMLSCLLLWLGGAAVYTGLPAQGPAYASPSLARELRVGMPIASGSQQLLGENYARVVAAGAGGLASAEGIDPTRGVAALPSLHVAFHALFALWAWSERSRALPLLILLCLLTFVGSVRSGWHYAVDGYVGIALAWLAWQLARRAEPPRADPDALPGGGSSDSREEQATG